MREPEHTIERVPGEMPPGIIERFRTKSGTPAQVVTSFAPAATSHAEYPSALPFIPDAATYVTEYPGGELPPGARWLTTEPDRIVQRLIEHSRAEGWTDPPEDDKRVKAVNAVPKPADVKCTYLTRDGSLRTILIASVQGQSVVQLLDAPPLP